MKSSSNKRIFVSEDQQNPKKQTVKKLKSSTNLTQSNTLLNYFESNNTKLTQNSQILPKQFSILSYFKQETDVSTNSEVKSTSNINEPIEIKSESYTKVCDETNVVKRNAFDLLKPSNNTTVIESKTKTSNIPRNNPNEELDDKYDDEQLASSSSNGDNGKSNRKCPFYKRIEGTQIVVDAFSYGDIENCNAYFLSHYHYDHFIGLNKHFKHNMYCSKITANLVIKNLKVDSKQVHPLEMNKFLNVYPNDSSIQVALVDANHCPGSVMFLFKFTRNNKYVLHTGDFRASDELINDPILRNIKIDAVHLDTTYCDSYYTFLPQTKIIELGVNMAMKEFASKSNNKTLLVCGSYTIGKERIFLAIAEALQVKVHVTRDKFKIIECLDNPKIQSMITLNPNETFIHVIPMGKLNIKDLQDYLDKYPSYENLIAIKPTGWTHSDNNPLVSSSKGLSVEKKSKNITIYGLEYSEHSSFDELKKFISTHRPRKIIPHVNVAKKEMREKMQSYFQQWLKL